MHAISRDLRPVLRQYSCAPATLARSLRLTRGRSAIGATVQRLCNGVGGEGVASKSMQSLVFSRLQRLQRCNGAASRVCVCDATRCGHTYARGPRCAVAVLQSSFEKEISMAWAATALATLAATAVAAPALALSAIAAGARSIKYPRISAGAGRRLRIGSIWGVGCACAGSLAAPRVDQALAGSAIAARPGARGEGERYQWLSACRLGAFASFAFACRAKAQEDQLLSLGRRLTDRVKQGGGIVANDAPPLPADPAPRLRPAALFAAPFAALVGWDREASPRGGVSIGIGRVPAGPGRTGPRGTGLQVAGSREFADG